MSMDNFKVPIEKLRRICDFEEELKFCETSQDAKPFDGVIGQERADKAMNFGLAMRDAG